jgi:hypothetical protein
LRDEHFFKLNFKNQGLKVKKTNEVRFKLLTFTKQVRNEICLDLLSQAMATQQKKEKRFV